jgi:hypothetical protein
MPAETAAAAPVRREDSLAQPEPGQGSSLAMNDANLKDACEAPVSAAAPSEST